MNWNNLSNKILRDRFHKAHLSQLANEFNTTEEEIISQAHKLGLGVWRTSKGAIVTHPVPGVLIHKTY